MIKPFPGEVKGRFLPQSPGWDCATANYIIFAQKKAPARRNKHRAARRRANEPHFFLPAYNAVQGDLCGGHHPALHEIV